MLPVTYGYARVSKANDANKSGSPAGYSGRSRNSRGPDFLRRGQRPDHEPDRVGRN